MQIFCNSFTYGGYEYPTAQMRNNCKYVCYATFDGAVDDEIENAYELELTTSRTGNYPQNKLINTKYADALTFDIVVISTSNDGFPLKDEHDAIVAFNNSDEYKIVTIDGLSERFSGERFMPTSMPSNLTISDVYFNAIISNVYTIKRGNVVQGLKLTFTCDAPYAWQDYIYSDIVCDSWGHAPVNYMITSTDDKLNRIYPKYVCKKVERTDVYGRNIYPDYDTFATFNGKYRVHTQKSSSVDDFEIVADPSLYGGKSFRLTSNEKASTGWDAAWIRFGNETNNYGCVRVYPGKQYVASFYAYTKSTKDVNIDMYLYRRQTADAVLESGTFNNDIHIDTTINVTQGWKRFSIPFTTTATYPYASIRVGIGSPDATVYFDGFMIEQVAPGTTTPSEFNATSEGAGLLYIYNENTGRTGRIYNVNDNETVTIDTRNSLVYSDSGRNLYNEFNRVFVYMLPTIDSNRMYFRFDGVVTVSYSLARKVGT